ncbi:hypothetical protein AVEN_160743-1 [Araneus ventricosus]|uniref:Uncharacterized protein n=1 Tax=Araneus ventricosus TaxID=182803 RepID=A0A4Y2GAZ7_ARAVE|nr:hypothetical protein AVEN_160743-1 [Araneus ventricosus]
MARRREWHLTMHPLSKFTRHTSGRTFEPVKSSTDSGTESKTTRTQRPYRTSPHAPEPDSIRATEYGMNEKYRLLWLTVAAHKIFPIMIGSCDEPRLRKWALRATTRLLYPSGKREPAYLNGCFSSTLYSFGTLQSVGASVMVWDVCSWRDMGPLIRLETTLKGDRYLSILSDRLHSFMSIVHSDGLGQFQQDNGTPHASRVTTKWLQEHSSNFRYFH